VTTDESFGLETGAGLPCPAGRLAECLISNKTTNTAAKIPRLASVAEWIEKLMTRQPVFAAGTGVFTLTLPITGGGAEAFRMESLFFDATGVGEAGPDAGGAEAGGGLGSSRANLTNELAGTRTDRNGINGAERVTACW
jgi:hypothetical protein